MRTLTLVLLVLGVAAPTRSVAESKTYTLVVAAGKHDRVNTPVRVLLDVPLNLEEPGTVLLRDATGKPLPAQVTVPGLMAPVKPGEKTTRRVLHFLLPSLKAGASATFQATLSTEKNLGANVRTFGWVDTPGEHAELWYDSRPVMKYMYKALDESSNEKRELTYKVFHHLYDPTGMRLVTKGAGGQYTHHRGLYYGFNRITYGAGKKADIWHCTGNVYQSHDGFLNREAGEVLGRHLLAIGWHGQDKELFAVEHREMTVYLVPGGQLVDFASLLTSKSGKIKLDGDPQHAGFHFRADNEVAEKTKKETYYVRPDGPGKPGETRNWDPKTRKGPVDLPWNAMSFVLGGQRYTAAYLDKPTNPKEARGSERDYGRFGTYFEHELSDGKPLLVNYRIWLQSGEMKGAEVAALSANFVEPPVVSVK